MTRLHLRLLGLGAAAGLMVSVLGVPAVLLAIDAVPSLTDFGWSGLTGRDDGTLALAVIEIVAWMAWAIFALSIVLDAAARIRGIHAPRLPGLAIPQLAAGRLVGIAALLFVSVPALAAIVAATSGQRAVAVTAPTAPEVASAAWSPHTPSSVLPSTSQAASPQPSTSLVHQPEQRTESYRVKRGDSLWKIAKERLGDGTRYAELVDLNHDVLGDHPDFLVPGTVIRVPIATDADHDHGATYIVKDGDTLSEIAEVELDNPAEYPDIFAASRRTTQRDGQHLTDPDLIRPGWRLTIPIADGPETRTTSYPPATRTHRHPTTQPPPPLPPSTRPEPGQAATPANAGHESVATDDHAAHPAWLLPGLAGAGALLAGSLLIVLRQHHRTRLRYRVPGRIVAAPPPELRPVEKSAHLTGSVTVPRIDDLDRGLRHLTASDGDAPRLVWVALTEDEVHLHLAEPANLPRPWSGNGTEWQIRLTDVDTDEPDVVAPYPLLVSIGQADDGALILMNLEEAAAVAVTGDPERAVALARHIAAELALNPWSALVEVDTLGIGDELATIAPSRCRQHHRADFMSRLASDLEDQDPDIDPDQYRALIASTASTNLDAVEKVAKIITSYPGRAGAAVVLIGSDSPLATTSLHLDAGGRLHAKPLGLNLTATGLTAEEAHACARLVDLTREPTNEGIPSQDDGSPVDLGGALTPAATEPRPMQGATSGRSLLPAAVEEYESAAATTREDIERLAPLAPEASEAEVDVLDPQLDDDLARWDSPALIVAKLTLLGPVKARGLGEVTEIARRQPFYTELLAYLALRPRGSTIDEIRQAFGLREARARTDLHCLRAWLGQDPRTHRPYFPAANQKHGSGPKGTYRLDGVLSDLDLFRRLRERGQRRGAAGIQDLTAALSLVTGEPFSDLRTAGWTWLLDGDRIDQIMTAAIADVAHIVTTHALTAGDINLARFAAQAGYRGAPYDETVELDLIAVDAASGDDDAARRRLRENVLNRSDDELGPIETPPRTEQIIQQRRWKGRPVS